MKNQNLITKLKRTLLIVGVLTLSLGATGCTKAADVVETSIAVETTVETKDFSMDLETLSPEEESSVQAEMDSIEEKTDIDIDTGELVVYDTTENSQMLKDFIEVAKADYAIHEGSEEEFDTFLDNALATFSLSEEQKQAYKDEIKSTPPTESPVETKVANKETPKETASKPAPTKPADQPTQTPTPPTQTPPKEDVVAPPSGFLTTPEENIQDAQNAADAAGGSSDGREDDVFQ